jgi:hypothetical protein
LEFAPRAALALLAICGIAMLPGIALCLPVWQDSYGDFKFLSDYVSPSETVLADEQSSLKEPAFGGRVVAYTGGHLVGFVEDLDAREADRARFLDGATSNAERRQIIDKYKIKYVLLNRREVSAWPTVLRSVERLGAIRYWDGDVILISVL